MRWIKFTLLLLAIAASAAQAQLKVRVSVKFILNAGGHRSDSGPLNTDEAVRVRIEKANEILDHNRRGYRLELVEILEVRGASQWFLVDTHDLFTKMALESDAKNDRSRYGFRSDSINIYVVGTDDSAMSSYPFTGDIILTGRKTGTTVFVHEIGHFMGLGHTQGYTCGDCTNRFPDVDGSCGVPGDDFIADTLPDVACWDSRDEIAQYTFHMNYSELSDARERRLVDDVFFNVMSYHSNTSVLTNDQLDRWTDAANFPRIKVVSGRTWFVDLATGCAIGDGSSDCSLSPVNLGGPFRVVSDAVDRAIRGDIILVRRGNYPDPITITKGVTLRASRGNALIGRR